MSTGKELLQMLLDAEAQSGNALNAIREARNKAQALDGETMEQLADLLDRFGNDMEQLYLYLRGVSDSILEDLAASLENINIELADLLDRFGNDIERRYQYLRGVSDSVQEGEASLEDIHIETDDDDGR